MSAFFFSPGIIYCRAIHIYQALKERIQIRSSLLSACAQLWFWTALLKWSPWCAGCHLECCAEPWGRDRKDLIWMPKQVSGLWFHGFGGLSHVTFSAWSSSILDSIPRPCATLNSVWVAVVGFFFFFPIPFFFFFGWGLGGKILPGCVSLHQTFRSRTYYSGWDGQISKVNREEKRTLRARNLEKVGAKGQLHYKHMIQQKRQERKEQKRIETRRKLNVWWMGWRREEEKVWVSSPAERRAGEEESDEEAGGRLCKPTD